MDSILGKVFPRLFYACWCVCVLLWFKKKQQYTVWMVKALGWEFLYGFETKFLFTKKIFFSLSHTQTHTWGKKTYSATFIRSSSSRCLSSNKGSQARHAHARTHAHIDRSCGKSVTRTVNVPRSECSRPLVSRIISGSAACPPLLVSPRWLH